MMPVKSYQTIPYAFVGKHPAIEKIRELISVVSDTAFNVLLTGETGTGKEVVARLLHNASPRRRQTFIKVNCGALPMNLLESELFGYEKGAFTGAVKSKPGKFELASGGVILLDEIGDMPLILQAKLLHVLQSGEFNRLGGTHHVKVNAWIISSTNHDLEEDMRKGLFREDLYYRLNIIKIEIPPLRERREDIPLLTEHLIQRHRQDLNMAKPFAVNSQLGAFFQAYHWPGNVRELSSTIMKLMVGDDPEKVRYEILSHMKEDGLIPPTEITPTPYGEGKQGNKKGVAHPAFRPLRELKAEAMKYIEKKAIMHALNTTGWNKREVAKKLRISYKALFYKMDAYGIRERS